MQMGDPTGTGKGGESVWGGKFQDEIKPSLRHSERVSDNTQKLPGCFCKQIASQMFKYIPEKTDY